MPLSKPIAKLIATRLEMIAEGIKEFRWEIRTDYHKDITYVRIAYIGGQIYQRDIREYERIGIYLLDEDLLRITKEEKERWNESEGSGEDTSKKEEYRETP